MLSSVLGEEDVKLALLKCLEMRGVEGNIYM
jgi:hypothetical protein